MNSRNNRLGSAITEMVGTIECQMQIVGDPFLILYSQSVKRYYIMSIPINEHLIFLLSARAYKKCLCKLPFAVAPKIFEPN